jgi:hypothetical protein
MLFPFRPTRSSLTDIGKPAGLTSIFRAGFSVNGTTYDDNTASVSATGSPTWNASGGALGGAYVSGLALGSIYYAPASAVFLGDASSANWITCFAWVNTANSSAAVNASCPRLICFGDSSGGVSMQFGVSSGKASLCGGTTNNGTINVADSVWHLLCWQQVSQSTWNVWTDKTKELSAVSAGAPSTSNINQIGSGFAYAGAVAMDKMDGIQIYKGQLSDSQVQEVYTQAGY